MVDRDKLEDEWCRLKEQQKAIEDRLTLLDMVFRSKDDELAEILLKGAMIIRIRHIRNMKYMLLYDNTVYLVSQHHYLLRLKDKMPYDDYLQKYGI